MIFICPGGGCAVRFFGVAKVFSQRDAFAKYFDIIPAIKIFKGGKLVLEFLRFEFWNFAKCCA
jgi:hypothetical protein